MKSNCRLLAACLACGAVAAVSPLSADTLTSLGRVLPRSGLVDVAGVPGGIVEGINVSEGDWVEAGQSLARLSSASEAAKRLAQAEADLAAARASAKQDVAIAKNRVALAEAEAKFAAEKLQRIASARDSEFISPDQIGERTLQQQSADIKLSQARQDLEKAVREADKAVRAAEADLAAARDQLARAEVRAPIKARVLKVRARPGSPVGAAELFRLGDTSQMIVVAEVYEADVLKVKVGQKASISSAALPKKMSGTVASVSSMIARNALESIDPNESSQSRIVEVTIRMDESSPLDRLVLLQVDVTITL